MTALRKLTKEDVITFFTSHISSSERRRKMSCHVISTCEGGAGVVGDLQELQDGEKPEARKVTDITAFKSSLPLFPLAQPFVELESLVRTTPAQP